MSRSALSLAVVSLGLLLFHSPAATAQEYVRGGIVSEALTGRYGLERAWVTRVQLDSARNRVEHLSQHVSSTRGFTAHEIDYDGGKLIITERDLDQFGDPLGKEQAEKMATDKVQRLTLEERNPKLTTSVIPEVTLYATTTAGVVQAIDAQTGRSLWATRIGNPRYVTEGARANDDYVGVVNGTTLFVLSAETGNVAWRREMSGAPGAGPSLSQRYAFVPMIGGTIEGYLLDDHRQPPWIYRSHGRAMVQPIFTGRNIAWPTDRGYMYVAQANSPEIRYRLETNDAIVAPAARMAPIQIVVASTDGYAYCLHEQSGSILWRFSTGERLIHAPFVVGKSVYLVTDLGTLFCLEGGSGLDQWSTSGVGSVVAASENRLYCVSRTGRLMILDPESGAEIGMLPTETLDLQFQNQQTDRIILGTRSGLIQCLRETGNFWPLIHEGAIEKAEDDSKKPAAGDAKPAADDKPAGPAPNPFGSPFGDGGGASPFGGGSDPFGSGAGGGGAGGGGTDPFGSGGSDPFGSGGSNPFESGGAAGGSTPPDDPFGGAP